MPREESDPSADCSDRSRQWRSQDSAVGGAEGVWGTEVPQRGPGAEPLVWGARGAKHPRKLTAYNEYLAAKLCTVLCV